MGHLLTHYSQFQASAAPPVPDVDMRGRYNSIHLPLPSSSIADAVAALPRGLAQSLHSAPPPVAPTTPRSAIATEVESDPVLFGIAPVQRSGSLRRQAFPEGDGSFSSLFSPVNAALCSPALLLN
jgi:hypothetical protein